MAGSPGGPPRAAAPRTHPVAPAPPDAPFDAYVPDSPAPAPRVVQWLIPDRASRAFLRRGVIRVLVAANLLCGFWYVSWRYAHSINWAVWPLALALLAAETYSYADAWLFGMTMWRIKERPEPAPPPPDATVDVFITCYNEPVELVRETLRHALAIRWPHRTYVLDDGSSLAMRAMAEAEGAGYIVRSEDWQGRNRHAKAGNLNNALFQTQGEFLLILDADQIPSPAILDRTLGYFHDPRVAFVQTPQWFWNVPPGDPFGSQAPLFYGPIQQGKDGWNAAFFCGSNAVLRREALMQMGVRRYVWELERRVRRALRTADRLLARAETQLAQAETAETIALMRRLEERTGAAQTQLRNLPATSPDAATDPADAPGMRQALAELEDALRDARRLTAAESGDARRAARALRDAVRLAQQQLRERVPIQEVTWAFQQRAQAVSRRLVAADMARIRAELADIPGLEAGTLEEGLAEMLDNRSSLDALASREASPLAAIEAVRGLLLAVDVDRQDEAQAVMPMSTISVTEDMATAMRLHTMGWKSVYHHEVLARGMAPEDLRTALQQRLRWAQGTIQVMFRENPLLVQGNLSPGQRLMYFATMWSYLSGFFAPVYLLAPVLYLVFGLLPVRALSGDFFWHLVPYLLLNQLLFAVVGWGVPTWRGQQYSLALFPLWIKAVTSAVENVVFGKKLGFVVTPKTRPGGGGLSTQLPLIRPQVATMAILVLGMAFGLAKLALGLTQEGIPILVNVLWGCYDLIALSVVLDAAAYQAPANDEAEAEATVSASGTPAPVGAEAR